VLPFTDVLDLFTHELSGLRRGCLSFPLGFLSSLQGLLFGHLSPLGQSGDENARPLPVTLRSISPDLTE
jgi:hypothetical protein